jgi:hypothetical protein
VRALVQGDPAGEAFAGVKRARAVVQPHQPIRRGILDDELDVVEVRLELLGNRLDRGRHHVLEFLHAQPHG